ncbi:hypothetical protein OO015_08985 [Thermomicrobium sp. 4228-Ro]|uniref:hypothetical protein n=1 Tax=Thermomicrobium sp. 4228-Ro TaxID=2993937 RepID=UPI0022498761|nr:hypothetical protein [Thermomicrobium sp. 4228-Ro]MCX2727628.1 hypothetical protein [Thermomicrobium sp. 4228-Ro]
MRRWLSANVVLLVLVTCFGLFLFPTECSCGAVEPHPHALFTLPGHHHGPHIHHETDERPAATRAAVPNGQPSSIMAWSTLLGFITLYLVSTAQHVPVGREEIPPRWSPAPEPPPPRP